MSIEQTRSNMVVQQIRPWYVLDDNVLDLLYKLKREEFVPVGNRELAFVDMEIPIGHGETMLCPKLEARLKAEHAADRARLLARLGLRAERVQGKQTYAILVLREASGWIPADPDLERHASELIQAFPMGSADARSFYGADAARPGLRPPGRSSV